MGRDTPSPLKKNMKRQGDDNIQQQNREKKKIKEKIGAVRDKKRIRALPQHEAGFWKTWRRNERKASQHPEDEEAITMRRREGTKPQQ